MIAFSRPDKNRRITSLNSFRLAIVEPIDVHLLPEEERDGASRHPPRLDHARHEPAAALQRADRVLPGGSADVLDDDVHAALVGASNTALAHCGFVL